MTRLLAALVLLWLACCAWTLPISWRYPSTNVDGTPLTDLDHAELTLRRCNGDSLRLPNIPATGMEGDSAAADLSISDSVYVVAVEARAVDHAGNRSLMLSLLVAHEKAEAPPPPPPDTTSGGLAARYYIGQTRGGAVVYADTSNVDFSWGLGSPGPGMPVDDWSAEWIGKVAIPTAGTWTWYLKSEDGAQLFLDGTLGINHLVVQPLTEWTWTVNMAAREYAIQVIYRANVGNSECHLSWSGPGVAKQIVPRGMLR